MKLGFIDWIWNVRGSLALAPGQSGDDAFDRLEPLFRETGTRHQRTRDVLSFTKKDQAAQDRMSVFDGGALRIDNGSAGAVLRYHLTSRTLLACFLAPLLFLALAQLIIVVTRFDAAPPHPEAVPMPTIAPMNPVDKFLGAPAPEPPKKDKADADGGKKKLTPTAAYVFAGIFAVLYVVGRILEDRLVKALFRKRLLEGSRDCEVHAT